MCCSEAAALFTQTRLPSAGADEVFYIFFLHLQLQSIIMDYGVAEEEALHYRLFTASTPALFCATDGNM